MATERLIIEVQAKGVRTVQRNLKRIRTEASAAQKTLALLRAGLVVVAGARVIGRFVELADTLTNVRNRLRLVTSSTQQLNDVQTRLFEVSQNTRSSFEANAELFNRLTRSTQALELTFNDLLDITQGVNQAIIISGATAQEASNGLIQFSQGLASGTLRGDELRSVVEQFPKLADVIGKEFGVAGGELAAFAKNNEGVITTERIIRSLQAALPDLSEEFKQVDVTISGSFQRFQNSLTLFIGGLNEATDVSKLLAKALDFVATNLDKIAAVLVVISSIVIFNLLVSQVDNFARAIFSTARFLVGPLVGAFRLLIVITRGVALGLLAIASIGLGPLLLIGAAIAGAIVVAAIFRDRLIAVAKIIGGAVQGAIDRLAAAFLVTLRVMTEGSELFGQGLKDVFITAINFIIKAFSVLINAPIRALNKLLQISNRVLGTSFEGIEDLVQFDGIENTAAGKAKELANFVKNAFAEELADDPRGGVRQKFEEFLGFFGQFLPKEVTDDIRKRLDALATTGEGTANQLSKAFGRASNAFEKLLASVDPLAAGLFEIRDAQKVLTSAVEEGITTQARADNILELVRRNVVGVGNAQFELSQKIKLVNLQFDAQAISAKEASVAIEKLNLEATSAIDGLLGGIFPLLAANRERREQLVTLAEGQGRLNDLGLTQEDVLKRLRREQIGAGQSSDQLRERMILLSKAIDEGAVSLDEAQRLARGFRIAFLEGQTGAAAGAERAFLDLVQNATDAAAFTEMVFTDAFKAIEDAVVGFVQTGKFEINDFFRSLSEQLIRLGTQQAIAGIGGVFTNLVGGGLAGPQQAGGGPGGLIAGLLGGLLPGFQGGASFSVGANSAAASLPGIDNRLIAFRARDGEEVNVTPKNQVGAQGGGNFTVVQNIVARDVNSFQRSESQLRNRALASLDQARRRR